MRHASGNLHTSYNDMQHHPSHAAGAAIAAASTTTSGHSATRATAERAPPAGDENNRQPSATALYKKLSDRIVEVCTGSSAAIHQGSSSQLTIVCILKTM